MKNLSLVAEVQSAKELEHEELDVVGIQRTRSRLHEAIEVCVL